MTFGDFADGCSVVGLVVTFVLAKGAYQVKKRLEKVDLIPEHVQQLKAHADALKSFAGQDNLGRNADLGKETGELLGSLKSLKPLVSKEKNKTVDMVISALDTYNSNKNEDNLLHLSSVVYQLHREMEFVLKGLKY